jgi:eukaryotic-like serine/threonine-protein kinase
VPGRHADGASSHNLSGRRQWRWTPFCATSTFRGCTICAVDKVVAARMEQELTGRSVAGWTLAECIGNGKSALVFRAKQADRLAAVKIFDRDLVDRFGKEPQRERVLREKSLVGRSHPHLIDIFDAGEDLTHDVFFVVMALFAGKNLAEALHSVPHDRVHHLIAQVASAAQFLESVGLAHRDIKPENVGIADDFSSAVLMDLGVLRPIGFSEITDQPGQRTFVGTLQYSPPELLHRHEQDSVEGWRAVTFYQLGAVLHDLLTRKQLFSEDLTPYARLVDAVSRSAVVIEAPGAPADLRMLAQDCLVKDWQQRLQLVNWDRFQKPPSVPGDMPAVRERIAQRRRTAITTNAGPPIAPGVLERRAVEDLRNTIERSIRDGCKRCDLPAFRVETDDSAIARVNLFFGPSRGHALTAHLGIYVQGIVLDAGGSLMQVEVAVALVKEAAQLPTEASSQASVKIFQGVRTDDVLAQRLTDVLLLAVDTAQEACAQCSVPPTAQWLDLPGEW